MPDAKEVQDWSGKTLLDSVGSKIGTIDEIYVDQQTERPEWALVHTGLFGTKSNFVPLTGAKRSDDEVTAAFTKEEVKNAPGIEPDGELSQAEEAKLYAHYGVDYGESRSDSGLPEGEQDPNAGQSEGHDTSGPTTDDAMTRSEEELNVDTVTREKGRARLRKHVVTENVETTVPVQREEVRIEREPITDANAGAAVDGPGISEEEHEVVLHEEEVVTEKRVVPKERVRIGTETVTDEQTVSEDVRKEQIETDSDR
jgi:uncharacterized protein (TIGR02271 family)